MAMGPVIASIHAKRDELRDLIVAEGDLGFRPKLRSTTAHEVGDGGV
jgi:CPA2 family monovalent cation:H+ antiporter-2